jgi:bifunctional NMN adenylyltransferase/nudix hydrolase
MRDKNQIGVIVGRYQVHELHQAHCEIIEEVMAAHPSTLLFLGVSPVAGSTHNPLDFTSRRKMIQAKYPDLTVLALPDMRSDDEWSKTLDARIREVHPMGDVVLYGGRDSFIPHYRGVFKTKELAARTCLSGTEIRKHVSEDVKASRDWRAGVIYGSYNRYPTSYQTVDIAVFNEDSSQMLLAQKPGEDKWRFVGGFVSPSDTSLEAAARREFGEEAGDAEIAITDYVGSFRVDDWRYRAERDKIMTTLFRAKYVYGRLQASDDISALRWFDVEGFDLTQVVEEHRPMMVVLLSRWDAEKTRRAEAERGLGVS